MVHTWQHKLSLEILAACETSEAGVLPLAEGETRELNAWHVAACPQRKEWKRLITWSWCSSRYPRHGGSRIDGAGTQDHTADRQWCAWREVLPSLLGEPSRSPQSGTDPEPRISAAAATLTRTNRNITLIGPSALRSVGGGGKESDTAKDIRRWD